MSTDGRTSPPGVKVTTSIRRVRTILSDVRSDRLLMRPPFQRKLVWSDKDKLNFLDTVLRGYPFPEIYVAAGAIDTESGEGTEWIVDGQQRVSTLSHYFSADPYLKLGRDFQSYASLSEAQKIAFLDYEVVTRDLGTMPHDDIVEVFARINATQYGLRPMEIHHANYRGDFKQFGVEIAEHRFFSEHRVFTINEIRRMSDVTFSLTFIITVMFTYFNREVAIEEYLSRFNDAFEGRDDIRQEIEEVIEFIELLRLPSKSRAWKRSDLLTLLVEVHRALIRKRMELDPEEVRIRLIQFYDRIDSREEVDVQSDVKELLDAYYSAAVQATNDRANRIRRGEIIQTVISGEGFDLLTD